MATTGSAPRPGRLRRIALYGVTRIATEGLLAARGVILAAVLGPELFGVWALFGLGLRYGTFPALGIQRGIEVEVAGSSERRPWGEATVAYLVIVFGALGLLCLAVSFAVAPPTRDVMRALALALLVQRLWAYGASYLRASGVLRRFAIVEVTQAALGLGLTVALARLWGLSGALAGYVVALAAGVALLGRGVPMRPVPDRARLRRLLALGMPLSFAAVTGTLLATVDRLIVVAVAGTSALGLYAFAVALSGIGAAAALVVRTVVFPDVYANARREGGDAAALAHLRDTLLPFACVFPPLVGMAAFALGPAVALIVPRYLVVLPAARLFLFSGMAVGLTSLGTLGVVATERQRILPLLTLGGLALNAGVAFAALHLGWGLLGVAGGALLSRSLTGAAVVAVSSAASSEGRAIVGVTFELLWCLAWCATSVFVVGALRPGTDVATSLMSASIYLATLLPLAPMVLREVRRQRGFEARHPR